MDKQDSLAAAGVTAAILAWCVVTIGLPVFILYGIIHFIVKFW